jgi:hypothetical protein
MAEKFVPAEVGGTGETFLRSFKAIAKAKGFPKPKWFQATPRQELRWFLGRMADAVLQLSAAQPGDSDLSKKSWTQTKHFGDLSIKVAFLTKPGRRPNRKLGA